ncbi:MAG: glycosyl hydrolase family 18 protein [Ktedonobacterales bacterium]
MPTSLAEVKTKIWTGRWARVALLVVVILATALGLSVWQVAHTETSYAGPHFNSGNNAVWLEHTWASDTHTAAEYDQLAARLTAEQIGYVYAHVGPLNSDGTIPQDRAATAAVLTRELHARMPNVRVLAWIGQMEAASGLPADQVVALMDSQVRLAITHTAARFVDADGFDGVHYDIEPIVNNNPHFLDLLSETHALLPPKAMLSISGEKWAPDSHIADWLYSLKKGGVWTSSYYASVAAHVDQIAVMSYDTAMPTAQLYELFVKEATQHILEAAQTAQHPPRVLLGIPTYRYDTPWFHGSAENMSSALPGVIAGLNSTSATNLFEGIAIYRYGVTTDSDWSVYDSRWLGK